MSNELKPAWAKDLGLVVNIKKYLCPPATVRILLVVDGSIGFNKDFGMGYIVQTLREDALSYVNFDVDLAIRGATVAGDEDVVERATHPPHSLDYASFRFDRTESNGSRTIDKYGQIWIFGIRGENSPGLSSDEQQALRVWMDAGGGILAMGDHGTLGAALCKDIPRVRHMRRWTEAQSVPPMEGLDRHDTNRPATPGQESGADYMPFNVQEDNVLQPLDWRRYPLAGIALKLKRRVAPHPILCDPVHGVLDVFPDHPHEGAVFEDHEVVANDAADPGDFPSSPFNQIMPETIAWVRTWTGSTNRTKGGVSAQRFGALGVYDGQGASTPVGRIVVDSTWHHWMTINLLGMEAASATSTNYARFQTFVRNVAVWLATEQQRKTMHCALSWLTLFTPDLVESIYDSNLLRLYDSATDVLGRTASECLRTEWIKLWYPPELFEFEIPEPWPWPQLGHPTWELLEAELIQGVLEAWEPIARDILEGRLEELPLARVTALFDEGAERGRARAFERWEQSLRQVTERAARMRKELGC
ncbi:MAG: hypothetical protein AAF682_18450 [Planctomycetota bacterium]